MIFRQLCFRLKLQRALIKTNIKNLRSYQESIQTQTKKSFIFYFQFVFKEQKGQKFFKDFLSTANISSKAKIGNKNTNNILIVLKQQFKKKIYKLKVSNWEIFKSQNQFQILQYQCNVSEIRDFEKQLVGYAIKLELIQNEKSFGTQQNMSLLGEKQQTEQLVYNQLQFKFIPKIMTFLAELGNEANSQRVDQSVNWDQQDQSSQITSNLGMEYQKPSTEKSDELQLISQSVKLDDGIKTLRLFENKIQDIEDREDTILKFILIKIKTIF